MIWVKFLIIINDDDRFKKFHKHVVRKQIEVCSLFDVRKHL